MSVAQRVAEERARLARERGVGEAAGSSSKPQTEVPNCDPEILPEDIAPAAEQVEAERAQAGQDAPKGADAFASAIGSDTLRTVVDQDGVLNYVETYQKNGRTCRQVFRSGTSAANDLILTTAIASTGKPPSQQTIAAFEAQLRTRAKKAGEVTHIALRVAQRDDARFIDLGPGRIVRITPQGVETVDESENAPLFRRGAGAGELPDPIPFDGDVPAALEHCVLHYLDVFQT